MLKYINVFFVLFFVACGSWPGDSVESGTEDNPTSISTNTFYDIQNDTTNYYDFTLSNTNNECQMIFYSQDGSYSSLTLENEDSNFSLNYASSSSYTSYSIMGDDDYTLSVYNTQGSSLGVYSPCFDGSETVELLEEDTMKFKDYNKLYYLTLSTSTTLTFSTYTDINEITILDSDFKTESSVTISDDEDYEKTLPAGTYYFLAQGSLSSDDYAKFKVEFE